MLRAAEDTRRGRSWRRGFALGVCALAWGVGDALAAEPSAGAVPEPAAEPADPAPAGSASVSAPTAAPAAASTPAPKEAAKSEPGPTDPEAQFRRGLGHALGRDGYPKDQALALKWYRKAAAQGDSRAQTQLGMAYLLGRGVRMDVDQALVWFHKAAEQNHPRAQLEIGIAYRDGLGVPRDLVRSHMWTFLSAQSGGLAGKFMLASSARRLTLEQREEALKLALAWRDEHPLPVAKTEGKAETAESPDSTPPAGSELPPGASTDPS